jgi:CRP-like cAMP-binding protein
MQDLIAFLQEFPSATFGKHQVLLSAQDRTDTLYVITSGFVKISTIDTTGSEQLLWIAGRSDIVPSELLFYKERNLSFFYTALSEVIVQVVDKIAFLEFAEHSPLAMKEIARAMSLHYDDLLHRLNSLSQASAREKLIYALHNIATRFSAGSTVDFCEIGLDLTHQDIGSLIGVSRETASIELKKLKDEGFVDYDRVCFVVHRHNLEKLLL